MKDQALAQALRFEDPQRRLNALREIDTRPPADAAIQRTLVTRHFTFVISHYHLPSSLMAGKLHALLTRGYPKGRDWYDLIWYRSRRPPVEPNAHFLQNALDQTQGAGTGRPIGARYWRDALPTWTPANWPATCSPSWSAPRTPPCSTAPISKQFSPVDPR